MNIKSKKSFGLLLLIIVLLFVLSISSCGIATPTLVSSPTHTPRISPTTTPQPTAVSNEDESLILPSSTPGPTATPGVITDMVNDIASATGLYQKTIFWVKVEDWMNLLVSIGLILIFGFIFSRLANFFLKKVVFKTESEHDDAFVEVIRKQINIIFITIGIQMGTLRLPFIGAEIKQSLNQIYIAIYVFAATVIVWRLLDSLVEWYQKEVEPERDANQTDTFLLLLQRIARVILVFMSAIMLLSLYNVNVNALIAALGVGGLALSLAAQDTLSNVISGLMIMMDQPFRVGDRIEIRGLGTWGDVVDIGLRTTRIRTRDNRLVIIPNNSISTDQVVNYSFPDPTYRIEFEIGVGYGQDIELVRQIIIDAVRNVEGVLPDRPVDALYIAMGESAMTFRVRWWIESFVDTRRMFDSVNTALQVALDEAGVDLPYTTYDVRVFNISDQSS